MRGKLGSLGLVLLAAAALGVPGAGGQAATPTTVIVQVIGQGTAAGGGGQISCGFNGTASAKACFATYVTAGTITLVATAAPGWNFLNWSSSPSTDQNCVGNNPCSIPLDGAIHEPIATFTTNAAPGTNTLTVSAPADSNGKGGEVRDGKEGDNIDCGSEFSECTWTTYPGSTLTVYETPDTGYAFSGWGGDCSPGGLARSCTVLLDTDRNVNASFTQTATFPLAVAVTGNGTVTGASGNISCTTAGGTGCSATLPSGTTVVLTATAGAGAGFTRWLGDCAGTSTICTLTMNAAKSVTAIFTGGTSSGFPLTVSVTGSGSVTGTGIKCGSGGTDCTQSVAAGTSVTLTETPDSGATFLGWGGACAGTAKTCVVRITAARTVTASFSTSSSTSATLTLNVLGRGSVSGAGTPCSSGGALVTCKHTFSPGEAATLTATAQPGQRFLRWSGSCSGSTATCTLTMDAAKTVTATFSGAVRVTFGVRGRAAVQRTKAGYQVTLRFSAPQRGIARLRALRAGRAVTALSFSVSPGPGAVGPFSVPLSGYYDFELRLGGRTIHWRACLGRCGARASARAFTLVREQTRVAHAGEAWSVTVHFRETLPSGAHLRFYKQGKLIRDYAFAPPAGEVAAGPFVLTPGSYTIRLAATDAYGRARTLTWLAFLPG